MFYNIVYYYYIENSVVKKFILHVDRKIPCVAYIPGSLNNRKRRYNLYNIHSIFLIIANLNDGEKAAI